MTTQHLSARTDRTLVRSVHHSTRHVVVEITAPPAGPARPRPRVNVSFVLDRSGSMTGPGKIGLAKEAIRHGIDRLAATDRFSVVVYDHEIDVVAAGRAADPAAKAAAWRALEGIEGRGNTNLGEGWLRGAEQVAVGLDPEAVNRVLLLTDGLANQGMTDARELARHAAELRGRSVSTSTFGLGLDFDEALLGEMADAGGGAFRFIERPDQIPALIGSEVGELLEVTARDVTLRVTGPDGTRVGCLAPYLVEPVPGGAVVRLGDLVADQVVRFVLALRFPLGVPGGSVGVELALASRDERLAGTATLAWTHADGAANDAQPRDVEVDRVVARAYADRALAAVVGLNRRGAFGEIREDLLAVARKVRGYAGRDPVLRGIVAELEREAENWSVVRLEAERKFAYADVHYKRMSRDVAGSALKVDRPDSR